MSTIEHLLAKAQLELSVVSETARLDAELLFCHILQTSRASLVANSNQQVSHELTNTFQALIEKRQAFQPIAYLTGVKEFYGLDFEVNESVLIPRPETELIVDLATAAAKKVNHPLQILDLGTGSGCVAVALAAQLQKFNVRHQILAVDFDSAALKVAKKNVSKHGFENSIKLRKSDWFSDIDNISEKFDIVISNPPYIAMGDCEVSPETKYEPQHALYSGQSGLDAIYNILNCISDYLKGGGCLICEIGSSQREVIENAVSKIERDFNLEFAKDLAGMDRAFVLSI